MLTTNPDPSGNGPATDPDRRVAGTGLIALDDVRVAGGHDRFVGLGGSCGNVLTALGLLGHKVDPIARLGADRTGAMLLEELRRCDCSLEHVWLDPKVATPAIIEHLDIRTGSHSFNFTCSETGHRFPSYAPITDEHFEGAEETIRGTEVFYCDRVSPATVRAIETAANSGAFVLFEPSSKRIDAQLLRRAISATSILKISEATSAALMDSAVLAACPIVVITHGKQGLTLRSRRSALRMKPASPPRLIDTCGAGDMLSAGLIHHLLRFGAGSGLRDCDLVEGLNAGMRLAALNCAFVGARGAFRAFGANTISNFIRENDNEGLVHEARRRPPHSGCRTSKGERIYSAAME